jgi:anti-sigma regulatory factor (Ser/Thr protein kinase)
VGGFGEMSAILVLPAHLQEHRLFVEFSKFLDENQDLPDSVEIDFGAVQFIRPPSVAFLSNMTHWLVSMGSTVNFSNLDVSKDPIKYLDDSLFFEQHRGAKLSPNSQCRSTTMPLKQLARRDSHAWLEVEFLPWLINKSGLNKNSLAEVKSSLQELINNISDHTDFEEGCIFGQWYPNKDQIIVTVADFGSGIPENVAKVRPGLRDCDAIIKAAEDGFSSQSLPTNRGAGLYLLLLNIVLRFGGIVTIRSGRGYVKFANRSGNIYTMNNSTCGYCIGTTIDIVLNTTQIPRVEDEEEEEFEW